MIRALCTAIKSGSTIHAVSKQDQFTSYWSIINLHPYHLPLPSHTTTKETIRKSDQWWRSDSTGLADTRQHLPNTSDQHWPLIIPFSSHIHLHPCPRPTTPSTSTNPWPTCHDACIWGCAARRHGPVSTQGARYPRVTSPLLASRSGLITSPAPTPYPPKHTLTHTVSHPRQPVVTAGPQRWNRCCRLWMKARICTFQHAFTRLLMWIYRFLFFFTHNIFINSYLLKQKGCRLHIHIRTES